MKFFNTFKEEFSNIEYKETLEKIKRFRSSIIRDDSEILNLKNDEDKEEKKVKEFNNLEIDKILKHLWSRPCNRENYGLF
jgi:hypothetical protein